MKRSIIARRKYQQGDMVAYHGKEWRVCQGGETCATSKSFKYKLRRGSRIEFVKGNCLK